MHKGNNMNCNRENSGRRRGSTAPLLAVYLCALACLAGAPSPSLASSTSAMKDLTCVGYRTGNTTCSAGEFTVSPVFSAAPGTPPFCIAGGEFHFKVDLGLSGTNTDRQDIGFFVGQQGNDPRATTPGNICSVATFPKTPSPWEDNDGDACGDFNGGGSLTTTIDEIKVLCAGDSAGALQIPYVLTYAQNDGIACTGPADVVNGAPSKCNAGVSSVSGTVSVFAGAYVDVTKQTAPEGGSDSFSFTATGPAGSKVIVLTGATLTVDSARGGTYTPATIAAASNSTTFTLRDGETARVYINALGTSQTLTITEATAGADWESTAAISCAPVVGTPLMALDTGSRSLAAALNSSDSAAACTITNMKRPRIMLQKEVASRIDSGDQFRVSAAGGGTVTGTASAATSGADTVVGTSFYSSPGALLTLSDVKIAGPTSAADYGASLTCSNAFTGTGATPPASLPSRVSGSVYSFTPAAGDDLTCTFTNTPRPTLGKAFDPPNIAIGESSSLDFHVGNHQSMPAQQELAFTDTLPPGVTVTAVSGVQGPGCSGTTSFTGSTVTLLGGAMNEGTLSCSFTATVRGDAAGWYQNDGTRFSGQGGGIDTSSARDALKVFAPPTAAKSFAAAAIAVGYPVTVTLTLANPAENVAPLSGISVVDDFPAAMVLRNTSFTFAPAACGSVTRSSGAASAAGDSGLLFSVPSLDPGASCQVSFNVSSSMTGDFTNTTAPPAATGPALFTGSSASATLNVYPLPLISILKSADRANADPGQTVLYTVEVVNTGAGGGTNIILTDELSPYASLFLGAGAPFTFVDSAPASGLSLGTPQYSNNNGATWVYTPVTGGGGAPAGYDGAVTGWRIPMTGTIGPGGSFTLNYRIKVK